MLLLTGGWAEVRHVVDVSGGTGMLLAVLLRAIDARLLAIGVGMGALAVLGTHRFWAYAMRHYTSASS